jgi:cyclopropane-fatty-acyl-phospholipid synthase
MRILHGIFGKLPKGSLSLCLPDGEVHTYGKANGIKAKIIVNDYRFFTRTVFGGEVGFGEAYTDGDWDSDDVTRVIRLFLENKDAISYETVLTAWVTRLLDRLVHMRNKNTTEGSRGNIASHYDLSNELYQVFLDRTLTYSCGLYLGADDDLETAQKNKLRSIIRKARIGAGDHVLDIGCGWGGFAIEAATTTGCQVTGITISEAQYDLARKRVRKAGLDDRISICLQDYRRVSGSFDKIVSIEMLEGVGHEYLGTFFSCCNRLLKPDGLLVLQVITYPDQGYEVYRKYRGWISKHVFPGGVAPSLTALCNAMTASSSFIVENLENIGIHYATTLRTWRTRFLAGLEQVEQLGFDRLFQRKWVYYLSACEAGFAARTQNDLQLVLTRVNNRRLPGPGEELC